MMHSMGDMDMGGMDSGGSSMFKPTNMHIARIYWYIIATLVSILGLIRLVRTCSDFWLTRRLRRRPAYTPSNSTNYASQCAATVTAIFREMTYPQPLYFTGRCSKFFTPPPLGNCLLLSAYWLTLLCMLWSNTILTPSSPSYAYKWEIVGFRAGWVSITQLPLIYLLSCKISPITLITGISAERLNWLHRWAARTIFLTVTVHWAFFFREWDLGKIVAFEFEMMPMVKYGFGAWGVLGWFILSGFGYFRQQAFEIFILQHIAAAATLLWLVWIHVPSYAAYNVWLAIAFIAVDWTGRFVLGMWRNIHVKRTKKQGLNKAQPFGYVADATALPGGYVILKIRNVDFTWKAGQHLHVSIPRLGIFQSHPFTIMSAPPIASSDEDCSIELFIKAHRGLTGRLYKRALKKQEQSNECCLYAFVNGPWGEPPSMIGFDTVLFVATSTGISFTLPQFRSLCSNTFGPVRRVQFHWITRHSEHVETLRQQIEDTLEKAACCGIDATAFIHYTRSRTADGPMETLRHSSSPSYSGSESSFGTTAVLKVQQMSEKEASSGSSTSSTRPSLSISPMVGRPSLDDLLRRPIEEAFGETAIVGCGGVEFSAQLRNFTSRISDERAVHKGSGAHGIYLYVEKYGL